MYDYTTIKDVCLNACPDYDLDKIELILRSHFNILCEKEFFKGKTIVVKPNLIMKIAPQGAATTHPAMTQAICKIIKSEGGRAIIAESSGGPYTVSSMRAHYNITGTAQAVHDGGGELNFDTSYTVMSAPFGVQSKNFNIITPIVNADIIINLCKLKAHGFTQLSAATKNLFGTIPGTQKFEMHARFSNITDFSGMIVDLCDMLHREKTIINIVDAIIAMEGNGPTAGTPRRIGAIISGKNPFAVDILCAHLIGFDNNVQMLKIGEQRALGPADFNELNIIGDEISPLIVNDFACPDTQTKGLLRFALTFAGGKLSKYLQPSPKINKKLCKGCGECVRSCPVNTIVIEKKWKIAKIIDNKCIKCYCCQELCPFKAVKIKKNTIFKIIDKMS